MRSRIGKALTVTHARMARADRSSTGGRPCRGRRACRWISLLALLAVPRLVRAEPQYVNRNNFEVYSPYLLQDNFSFLNPGENRFWQDEYARRSLMLTYGEARMNRPFYVDVGLEGLLPKNMPGIPEQAGGVAQEVQILNPTDIAVRAEVFGGAKIGKDWSLDIDVATRAHLLISEITAEFYGRLVATHRGFAGLNPLNAGLFLGPEIKALDVGVGGLTLGGFAMLSQSKQTYTMATLRSTWWGGADPFQNLLRFQVGQAATFLDRRLTARFTAGADIRQVRGGLDGRYYADFGQLPPRNRYIDLTLEGGLLAHLPGEVKVDLSGRLVPVHAADPLILRWYRPVYPELSFVVERKFAIFDVSAGYTFTWVSPKPGVGTYDDPGVGLIPNSFAGHLLTLNLNLRI